MAIVYEYDVVLRLQSGREDTSRVWAYTVMDAATQALIGCSDRCGADAVEGVKPVSVGPPVERCLSGAPLEIIVQTILDLSSAKMRTSQTTGVMNDDNPTPGPA